MRGNKKSNELKHNIKGIIDAMDQAVEKKRSFVSTEEMLYSRISSNVIEYFIDDVVKRFNDFINSPCDELSEVNEYFEKHKCVDRQLIYFTDEGKRLNNYLETIVTKQVIIVQRSLHLMTRPVESSHRFRKRSPRVYNRIQSGGLKFGQSTADKVLSFADGNKKLEMSIAGANKNSTIVPQTQAADFEPADKWEELITIENYSSSVMYSNVFNNAHIRYTTAGNQVKEDIIVFKKADKYIYGFNFTLTGLDAEMQADDSYGRAQPTTDTLGNTTTYNRTSATELLNYVKNANNNRTAYDYDEKERLTAIFNDKSNDNVIANDEEKVTYTYDAFGNVTTIKAVTYTLACYTYNKNNGKLLETAYGNGFAVTNVYDPLDRLVEVKYTNYGTTTTAYTVSYNGDGAVSKVVDNRSGITTEYDYDSLGRLINAIEYETAGQTVILGTENKYDTFGRPQVSEYDLPGVDISYTVDYKANSSLIEIFRQYNTISCTINYKQYTYDTLERLTEVRTVMNGLTIFTESYTYVSNGNNTSGLVATHTVDGTVYSYTYDNVGNITTVSVNGSVKYRYNYDSLNQLNEEIIYSDNGYELYEYLYDKSGNITAKNHHYGENLTNTNTVTYTYGNTAWGDLLTNYNGTAITYDAIGNPLKWRNAQNIDWYGRQLTMFARSNGYITSYTYNSDGIRTGKQFLNSDGDITGTVKYTLDGNKIVAENRLGVNIYYTYDDKGTIMGMLYGGEYYMFSKNLQGDVVGIYNESGTLIAKYEYSAYGEVTAITNGSGVDVSNNATHIANINPFRYRGYYYDTETGFYYLQSRYYDPVVGRFINTDTTAILTVTPMALTDKNLYAYCDNNPVIRKDDEGNLWALIKAGIGMLYQYGKDVYNNYKAGETGWNLLKRRSSAAEYIAAGVSAMLPGGSFKKHLISNAIVKGIVIVDDVANDRDVDLIKAAKDVLYDTAVNTLFSWISSTASDWIFSQLPENYSSYAHIARQKNPNLTKEEISKQLINLCKTNNVVHHGAMTAFEIIQIIVLQDWEE